ncbi:MAG: PEGA domain-containing protein [Thermoanaerobaculaceae bacterium]
MRVTKLLFLGSLALSVGDAQAHGRVSVGVHLGFWYPWWWGGWAATPVVVQVRDPELTVVDTDVSPEHARVFLDGQLIGTADDFDGNPDYLYLRPGTYTLEFVLPGYENEKVIVEAGPGRYFPLDFALKRKTGEKPAAWYDRPEGLPVARVFGKSASREKDARPDPSLRPELRAPGRKGGTGTGKAALRFTVEPPQAVVYLDGEFLGTGEELAQLVRAVAVEPGEHEVEVMAPGYESQKRELEVAAGQTLEVNLRLSPED